MSCGQRKCLVAKGTSSNVSIKFPLLVILNILVSARNDACFISGYTFKSSKYMNNAASITPACLYICIGKGKHESRADTQQHTKICICAANIATGKTDMDPHQHHGLTLPKLPLPSTIRKLKSDSFMRSWLPLESNRDAALADLPSVFLPGPILAL